MNPIKLAARLESVNTGSFTKAELLSYYTNVEVEDGPQELLEAIEERLRRDFPAAANAAFGKKSDEAMEMLTRVADTVTSTMDLSGNVVKSHVKIGGFELKGEHYICRYISYKNKENHGVQLMLSQLTADSEMLVREATYRTSAKEANFRHEETFPHGEVDRAVERYRAHLVELGAQRR